MDRRRERHACIDVGLDVLLLLLPEALTPNQFTCSRQEFTDKDWPCKLKILEEQICTLNPFSRVSWLEIVSQLTQIK